MPLFDRCYVFLSITDVANFACIASYAANRSLYQCIENTMFMSYDTTFIRRDQKARRNGEAPSRFPFSGQASKEVYY